MPDWRRFWDWAFFGGSFAATLLFGVAIGNAMITGVFFAANATGEDPAHWFQGFASSLMVVAVFVGSAALVAAQYWRVSRSRG